ncbi:MAG TPA: methyltransferase domain-containing protein, partial [Blastocatellia bacterium]|nr:methyltransferase domain-containing protein [Blastocatellia bacterium]
MACPLCDHNHSQPSWLGTTHYRGKDFLYVQCLLCKSLYCDPMPGEDVLADMYSPDYWSSFSTRIDVDDPREPQRVINWLKQIQPGSFIDYGCGDGSLLGEAVKLGWQAAGVEFDQKVASAVQERTGVRVVTDSNELLNGPLADALHLGDVLEHLTDMNRQMPVILKLLKPGGLLLAQGPLESNTNLFTLALKLKRSMMGRRRTEMAPYHVMLATAEG